MKEINDLQAGVAGEYLVCADLIINGHQAFMTEQGLPFDVVLNYKGDLYKCQVKTTRRARNIPQRKNPIPAYIFHIGSNGKMNRRRFYKRHQVDFFALVCLETKTIAYLPFFDTKTTMNFRVPELRGSYHDEQGEKNRDMVLKLKSKGMNRKEISKELNMEMSSVYFYYKNPELTQKGTNKGVYFDEFPLIKCLNSLDKNTTNNKE